MLPPDLRALFRRRLGEERLLLLGGHRIEPRVERRGVAEIKARVANDRVHEHSSYGLVVNCQSFDCQCPFRTQRRGVDASGVPELREHLSDLARARAEPRGGGRSVERLALGRGERDVRLLGHVGAHRARAEHWISKGEPGVR